MSFSKETQELLKVAGWYPGRNISGQYSLATKGYPATVIQFINEYGNLIINCKKHDHTEVVNVLEIKPEYGKNEYDEEDGDYSYYSGIIKKKLFPIGFFFPVHFHIGCDAEGRVYILGDACSCRGKNLYEGFDAIILGNWSKSLQLDEDTGQWWNRDGEYVPLP
jgi:hypothetical protein